MSVVKAIASPIVFYLQIFTEIEDDLHSAMSTKD